MSISAKEDRENRKAQFQIDNTIQLTKRGVRQGFYNVGKQLKESANKEILAKDKTGRTYRVRRGKVVRNHRASAPGETFANLSGAARRTLGFDVRGSSELEFGFRKVQQTFYTKILETRLNRPALGNAVKKESGNNIVILERELKKALT
jgi:hypothetical protein